MNEKTDTAKITKMDIKIRLTIYALTNTPPYKSHIPHVSHITSIANRLHTDQQIGAEPLRAGYNLIDIINMQSVLFLNPSFPEIESQILYRCVISIMYLGAREAIRCCAVKDLHKAVLIKHI